MANFSSASSGMRITEVARVQQGGTLNSSFSVELEGLGVWPLNDAVALLTNPGQLAANLDIQLLMLAGIAAVAWDADRTARRCVAQGDVHEIADQQGAEHRQGQQFGRQPGAFHGRRTVARRHPAIPRKPGIRPHR